MSKTKSTSIDKTKKKIISDIQEVERQQAKLNKKMKLLGKSAVESLKELINKSKYIEAIRWSQYTPHFADGDACEFGVHDVEFKFSQELTGAGDVDDPEGENSWMPFFSESEMEEFFESKKDIINFKEIDKLEDLVGVVQEIHANLASMEELLRQAFGDHVYVVVTKKGITTEECEHD